MNKVFKVIWSKSKQCYIVVSEVAKNTTGKKKAVVASVLAALTVGANVAVVDVQAADATYVSVTTPKFDSAAEITRPDVEGVIKSNKNSDGTSSHGQVAIGAYARTRLLGSIAVGQYAIAERNFAISVGNESRAYSENTIAIGSKSRVKGNQSIGIGVDLRVGQYDNNDIPTGEANEAIGIGRDVRVTANEGVAMGFGAKVTQAGGLALGKGAVADGRFSVALGYGSKVTDVDTGSTDKAYLSEDAVNNSGNGVVSIGTLRNAADGSGISRRIVGVAGGSNDFDAVNVKQLKALEAVSLKTLSVVNGDATTEITPADRKITLEAGNNINLTASAGKITIGTNGLNYMSVRKANTNQTEINLADVPDAVKSNVNNDGANGAGGIAIGAFARQNLLASIAIGHRAIAERNYGVSIGNESRAYSENGIAVGSKSRVKGNESIGIGVDLRVGQFDGGDLPTGEANQAIGIGRDVRVTAHHGVAVGFGANVTQEGGLALGKGTSVDGRFSTALGYGSNVVAADITTNDKSYITDEAVNNTGNGVVSVGTLRNTADGTGITRRIVGVAGGYNDYDAVNVKQLKALEKETRTRFLSVAGAANKTAADYADKIWTVGKDTTAAEVTLKGNFNNEGARGANAVAIGPWANGIGDRSLSVGSHAVAVGKQAITVGQSSFGLGENSLAVGSYATVNGNNSLAIGTDTYVGQATRSGSGKGITATETAAEYAMAIGFSAKTLASNAMTIGKGARTEIAHAITLGSASTAVKADADATTAYLTGDSVNNSGNGVLSIGNIRNTADGSGVTRRIVGVAGGTNDFDAVNVKQLKKLEENMKAAELHVKKGSYAVDADGNVALPKVNGNNVENADEVVNITGIASKTALETLKTEVAGKASAADLTTAVAGINKELAKKVSADQMNEAMASKANASDLQALTEAVKDKVDADALKKFTDTLGRKADEIKALNDNIARANKANEDAHAALKGEITDKITEAVTALKEAELHTIPDTYAVADDGTVTLKQANGTNPDQAIDDKAYKISGVATKKDIEKVKEDATALSGKVTGLDGKVTDHETRLTAAEADSKAAKNAIDNKVWNTDVEDKLTDLKTELSTNTILQIKGDTNKDKANADTEKYKLNLKDEVLTFKGATNEVTTAVKGNEVTIGLNQAVKDKLAKIDQLGDTSSNGIGKDGGLTGADGLNGKTLTEKVNALRNGEAGAVVFKDDQGNVLTKANDGQLYKKSDVGPDGNPIVGADGQPATPVDGANIQAVLSNPAGTTDPVKLSNVGAGKIAAGSEDAVNGAQIYAANKSLADALGGDAKVKDDGTIEAPTFNVTNEASGAAEPVRTVAGAVTNLDNRITAVANNAKNLAGLTDAGKKVITGLINVEGKDHITVSSAVDATSGMKTFTVGLDPQYVGTLTKDIETLKNNPAGSLRYTDTNGEPIVKGADGNYYRASELKEDGTPKTAAENGNKEVKPLGADDNVQMSLVPPVGKSENGMQLTNIKDGDIAENSKDAVNGNQIFKANKSLADALGGGAAVKDDGTIEAPTFNVTNEATGAAEPVRTVAGAVTNLDNRITAVANNAKNLAGLTDAGKKVITGLINVEGKDHITVSSAVDATSGMKTFTVGLDPQYVGTLTKDIETLKNNPAGSLRYTDTNGEPIVKGADGNYYRASELKEDGTPKTAAENGNKEVKPLGADDNVQMSLVPPVGKSENGMQLTNIKDGDIAENSKDAVNGNQIFKANTSIAKAIGGGATVKEDGTISEPTFNITKDSTNPAEKEAVHSVGAAIEALDTRINNARNLGDLTTEGKKVITGLINVTGEGNIEVPEAKTDDKGVKTFTVKLKDTVTLGKGTNQVRMDGTKGIVSAGEGKNKVEMNGADGTITLGEKDGDTNVKLNASEGSVTANKGVFGAKTDDKGVPTKDGENTTKITKDGVSIIGKGKDGKAAIVGIKDGRVTAGDPVDDKGIPKDTGSATSMDKDGFSVATKDKDGKVSKVDIKNGGITAGAPVDDKGIPTEAGTTTSMDKKNGFSVTTRDDKGNVSNVTIKDGKISGLNGAEYNNYETDKDGKYVTDKDGNRKVLSSVKMDGSGLTIAPSAADPAKSVSLTKDGLNNGGNKITNLAPGEAPTDAATVGQVTEAFNKVGQAVVKNSERISQVGAHSAALAAMNPLSYDPLRKTQVMAGIGSYEGNQALALGVAHYANENFMFNAGVTMGSGKSMANLGATYRFGTGDDDNIPERYKGGPVSSIYVMQDEITALKAENARKDAENAEMKAQIKMLMERMGMA